MKEAVIAHHEAGHAAIARILRVSVPYVTLFSDNVPDMGLTAASAMTASAAWHAREGDLQTQLHAIETDAKVSQAGPYAQIKFKSQKLRSRWQSKGWSVDLKKAETLSALCVRLTDGSLPLVRPADSTFHLTGRTTRPMRCYIRAALRGDRSIGGRKLACYPARRRLFTNPPRPDSGRYRCSYWKTKRFDIHCCQYRG